MVGGPAHVKMPANAGLVGATQQPQRGGTTSCASRPSAGIDRAKCLISLNATGEFFAQFNVPAGGGRGSGIRNVVPVPGPLNQNGAPFFR